MAVEETLAVAAAGPVTLTLPLPDTTWTAATGDGIDVAGSRVITLDAAANGVTRRLVLTRTSVTDPYPFARILRPGAAPHPDRAPAVEPDAGARTPTPTVTPVPTATPKAGVAGVASKSLKVKSNRVSTSLSCTGQTTCRGTVVLRSAVKVEEAVRHVDQVGEVHRRRRQEGHGAAHALERGQAVRARQEAALRGS